MWRKPTTEESIRVRNAKFRIARKMPYLASALWSMREVVFEDEAAWPKSVGVDVKWRLYINPAFLREVNDDELDAAMLHEVFHLLREHGERGIEVGAAEGDDNLWWAWQRATDLEVNQDVSDLGYVLPAGALSLSDYDMPPDLLAEDYYYRLLEREQQPKKGRGARYDSSGAGDAGDDVGSNSSGDSSSDSSGGRAGNGRGGNHRRSASGSKGKKASGVGRGSGSKSVPRQESKQEAPRQEFPHGSGSTGRAGVWEIPDGSEKDKEFSGVSAVSARWHRQEVARGIIGDRAEDGGMSMLPGGDGIGTVPGRLRRWAEGYIRPSASTAWRREIARVIAQVAAELPGFDVYTYNKPRRRQLANSGGILLPAGRRRKIEVAAVVDVSGSMSDEAIRLCLREATLVSSLVGSDEIALIACDTAVTVSQRYRRGQRLPEMTGGGGTDMTVGIRHAMSLKPKPDLIIVLTDCGTPWHGVEPTVPVIVGAISTSLPTPSWARRVDIPM